MWKIWDEWSRRDTLSNWYVHQVRQRVKNIDSKSTQLHKGRELESANAWNGKLQTCLYFTCQGLQILLMSGVGVTSALQILESFCNIWSQVSQRKKPFSDFPARGPGMYTLSWGIHELAVMVRWPGKLKSMMAVIEETLIVIYPLPVLSCSIIL